MAQCPHRRTLGFVTIKHKNNLKIVSTFGKTARIFSCLIISLAQRKQVWQPWYRRWSRQRDQSQ